MSELIDRQALKAAHGLGTDCATCKRDTRSCQYDRDFSMMDFCEWIDDAPAASPWHRVEEELPKDRETVLIYCENTGGIVKSHYHEFIGSEGKKHYWFSGGTYYPKYWMTLPEPPKEDE